MTHERALEIARSGNFSCIADMIQFAAQEQAEADARRCKKMASENRESAKISKFRGLYAEEDRLHAYAASCLQCAAKIMEGASK